ncbi:unnamed protein product [Polarella glacialis]|uniref:Uncharacterized protein n=1 Tax=Polarella glacialis TaxID=89957 RepID=A0A813FB52_POLGL|nr:unnamed protein product [Polarella glacialis]
MSSCRAVPWREAQTACPLRSAAGGVSALDLAVARGFEEGGEASPAACLLQCVAAAKGCPTVQRAAEKFESVASLCAVLLGVVASTWSWQAVVPCNAQVTTEQKACHKEAAVKILIAHNAEMPVPRNSFPNSVALLNSKEGSVRPAVASSPVFAACGLCDTPQVGKRSIAITRLTGEASFVSPVGTLPVQGFFHSSCLPPPAVSEDMVQYLVEQGADVNTLLDGFSVMRLERYVSGQGIELVFDIAAGVNHREAGCLPLHLAACRGHVDAVKVLLKANSNVHEQTDNGRTALDLACDALSMLDGADSAGEDEVFARLCRTIDALLARSCRLKEFKDESQLDRAREFVQREAGTLRKDALDQKEATKEDSGRAEARKVAKRRRDDGDEAVKAVEREVRAKVVEEEKKTDGYKESEKLAKKVAEAREVLQASWRGDGEKLPEYLSSKYYQIRIDVLRRKIQEKDQQIEEALKKMDFAEEDYLWLLRKRMRDLRLKHHPDKITDRQPTEEAEQASGCSAGRILIDMRLHWEIVPFVRNCQHSFHFTCIDDFHRQKLHNDKDAGLPCFTCGVPSNRSIASVIEEKRKAREAQAQAQKEEEEHQSLAESAARSQQLRTAGAAASARRRPLGGSALSALARASRGEQG